MLYHGSKEQGLRYLEPHVSTHGKSYVYAINNKITAACFGASHDDFDFLMDEIDGVPHLYECYPNSIEKVYEGKSCYIYEVSEEGFIVGKTGWSAELVCEHEVPVINEDYVKDLYALLKEAERQGKCVIHYYSEETKYRDMLKEQLGARIKAFKLTDEQIQNDPRLKRFMEEIGDSDETEECIDCS